MKKMLSTGKYQTTETNTVTRCTRCKGTMQTVGGALFALVYIVFGALSFVYMVENRPIVEHISIACTCEFGMRSMRLQTFLEIVFVFLLIVVLESNTIHT